MWKCKICGITVSARSKLLKHHRLQHRHYGRSQRYSCTYSDCPCSFKTWNALLIHLSRNHASRSGVNDKRRSTFSCHLCACSNLASEREYFVHINSHLKRNETVHCMFSGCNFQSNVYGTFKSHKNRKHSPHALNDFKFGVVTMSEQLAESGDEAVQDFDSEVSGLSLDDDSEMANDTDVVVQNLAAMLLKLEHLVHVPSLAIDDFLEEMHYLLNSVSVPLSVASVQQVLEKHELRVDECVIKEIADTIASNPLHSAIGRGGSLCTTYKRKQFYKDNFSVVEPVEYCLDEQQTNTFQYVPILKSLQLLLTKQDIVDRVVENHRARTSPASCSSHDYRSFQDGSHFKENSLLSGKDLTISLTLYADDFEVCNPLGTSRKKHKLFAVYWILSNLPPGSHSSLSSIYLAVLCKSEDLKHYGYEKVLEPLLRDLSILEKDGLFIHLLGTFIKGTVYCVVADNLAAHGMAGFVESFSGEFFCRFCLGKSSDVQAKEVQSGAFNHRTKEVHKDHVKTAQEKGTSCCGVKRDCVFTKHLSHFNVLSAYPPDVLHDIFEGVVPVELAQCLALLISKKHFTLESLNKYILQFPYKWEDQKNKPHAIPFTFSRRNTIGGNAHENWSMIRFLPFLIGHVVPEGEPAWQVLMDLKDIVELVVSPVHTDESISYLEMKISEHRQRYQELFPDVKLLPKHHFLEHYPEMVKSFGPLVHLWTMRFEAKHSFFKQVTRHTNCFKNVPRSLAVKHQLMISYHLKSSHEKGTLEVSTASPVPLDVLQTEVAQMIKDKYPNVSEVHIAKSVSSKGMNFRNGMILAHDTTSGLPDFGEIVQICVVQETLCFILRRLCGWYREHFRAFELSVSPTREMLFLEHGDLADGYPLADYMVGPLRLVTLKRQVIA